MSQRFNAAASPSSPQPQRYVSQNASPLRQYAGQNIPFQNRPGFNGPPMHGGNMIPQQNVRPGPNAPRGWPPTLNRNIPGGPPPVQAPPNSFHPYNMNPPQRKKKKKLGDKILPAKVRGMVPESRAYMDLIAFERKLDSIILRKRLDAAALLKKPLKQKRKLRIFITNIIHPKKEATEGATEEPETPATWELRIEGQLVDEQNVDNDARRVKKKFSSYFKSLVIQLDKNQYGPDNHLVEWHKAPMVDEPEGFKVKRPGDRNVSCKILLWLDYQPLHFRLDPRLARLLGVHTQTKTLIISALWEYIKTHKLQDDREKEFINCDKYLNEIFGCPRMRFAEIPQKLSPLLHAPDPILINHLVNVEGPEQRQTTVYDINVEVEDPLKNHIFNFLIATANQEDIENLDDKVCDFIESINQSKTNREFYLQFANDPQQFLEKWIASQTRDLKTMTDITGNPEEERRCEFFDQMWVKEAVTRYFYNKLQQKRMELNHAFNFRR